MPEPRAASVPAAASIALADVLDAPVRRATVLGVFPSALYAAVDDAVVAVVARDALRLPNALVVRAPSRDRPFAAVDDGAAVRVGGGGAQLGAVAVNVARWWDPRPCLRAAAPAALAAAVAGLDAALPPRAAACRDLAAPTAALEAAVTAGDHAAVAGAVDALVGLGPGLTPAGDDVLAGMLAALRLLPGAVSAPASAAVQTLRAAVTARAPSATTALSAALLRHATRGEVATPVARLVRALTGDGDVAPATHALSAVGHTSGRELAAGVALGARACLHAVAAATGADGGDR